MSQYSPIVTSFNGGEISPRMHGRVDQGIYQIAAAEMVNFVPTIEGPAMKRPGFRYIRAAMATASWLSSFIFSVTQAYVIEWGEQLLRFYTNGGRIETGGVPYEVAMPYTAAEAPSVSQQQSYDRLYLFHGSHPPASLLRTSATTFSYGALALKNGPFADQNTNESITITVTGALTVGGSVTLTASSPIFEAGHVGSPVMIEASGFSDIKAWEPTVRTDTLSVGDKRRSDGKVYRCADEGSAQYTGSVQPTHTKGSEWDGSGQVLHGTDNDVVGVLWEYLYDRFGIATITAVASGTSATATVNRRIADSLTATPTFRWSLPAISNASGWPKHGLLAFGRLIMFTDFELIASVVGDYGGGTVNMSPFTDSGLVTPDMAFRRRLSISNPILWVREDRDVILIGTADGTHAIRKVNSGEIFSSDNIEIVKQTHFGCEPVLPAQTGTSTIFVQRGGRKLREAGYSLDTDRYVSPNVNVWQRHILKSGARQLAFQADPEELLWAVRADGVLALHPHVPEQEVRGFARAIHAGGTVLSTTVVPAQDGKRDELWALVDGAAGRSVEQQAPQWEEEETELADAFFVDSGVSYDGPPISELNTGVDHLVGLSVRILADGAVLPAQTVQAASPKLTLPSPSSKIHVGLGYSARLTWLRPEVQDRSGATLQGKRKRLVSIILRVLETVGIKVDPGNGRADQLIHRGGSAPMDAPVPPFTGDTTSHPVSGDWNREGQGTIISEDPLPCMIVAAMPKIEVGS